MNFFERLIEAFRHARPIPESSLRAEAWALGARHRGEVLLGARAELKEANVPVARILLLHAVIRREESLAASRA